MFSTGSLSLYFVESSRMLTKGHTGQPLQLEGQVDQNPLGDTCSQRFFECFEWTIVR